MSNTSSSSWEYEETSEATEEDDVDPRLVGRETRAARNVVSVRLLITAAVLVIAAVALAIVLWW